ncbi:hypothetical protein MASR2M17_11470 [Aminivibrio sp.]
MKGAEMNLAIAEKDWSTNGWGARDQRGFPGGKISDLGSKIKAWSAAALDARMSGIPMPVMSSAGKRKPRHHGRHPRGALRQGKEKSEEKLPGESS